MLWEYNRYFPTSGGYALATLIQAIATYRPRIARTRTVDLGALADRLSRGTLVTRPIAEMVLAELVREIEQELRAGRKVRLGELGTFGVEVRLDLSLRPSFRFGAAFKRRLASGGRYRGYVTNRALAGLDTAALVARWNAEHPGDPVEGAVRATASR
ncbi:MAG: HU family DNA-binding protein [Anaerolineae bacterium]